MNRIICLAFFFVGLFLMATDLYEYYRIQHQFQTSSLVPIILLGILANFAFAPAKPAA